MLLGMELFLLVRHTHPPLRTEMENIHAQNMCSHNRSHAGGELMGGLVQTHGGGGFSSGGAGMNAAYLTMEDFSQGLLRVSEERETSVMNSAHSSKSISECMEVGSNK